MTRHRPTQRWRLVSLAATLTAIGLTLVGGVRLAAAIARSWEPIVAALALMPIAIVALLVADVASGIVHYLADHAISERAPLVGPNLVAPFRDHHRDPGAMVEHDVIETNGDTCLVALPVLILAVGVAPESHPNLLSILGSAFALSLGVAVAATNQIHSWAHAKSPPRVIRWAQRRGLILPPMAHAEHHRAHDAAYCITTGWCNGVLDAALTSVHRRESRSTRRAPDAPSTRVEEGSG